jgi:hypothetical protein
VAKDLRCGVVGLRGMDIEAVAIQERGNGSGYPGQLMASVLNGKVDFEWGAVTYLLAKLWLDPPDDLPLAV